MFNGPITKQNPNLYYDCALPSHQFIDRVGVFVFHNYDAPVFAGREKDASVPNLIVNLAHAIHLRSAIRSP